ncbi:MFS transporter [Trujillonella endophytica]|uniref:MFS/sugar transport protein n=1 Tax=Trujillonella endophytica TaxID=673521 RepID=A0A1H8WDG3_9ACTN|nr:MFS transporter [Trujillella endophytica]SEP25690.1 MFS/sugar transport protein [Trujillella endophytica]
MSRSPGGASHRVTFLVLAVGMTAGALLQSLVIPALATFQEALDTTQADATWILTATLLAAAIGTPIAGRLGDMLGRKQVFVAVLSVTAVGCLLSAVATSLPLMLAGRVVQGLGAGVLPLAFGIVRDSFPAARLAGAISTLATLAAVGSGAGVALAGPIEGAFGISGLFWVPLVLLVLAVAAAVLFLPSGGTRAPGGVSWTAAALLSAWLVCLLLGLSRAPEWGWGSGRVLGLLAGAVLFLALWLLVESRARYPLVDLRMMRLRGVWTANLVGFLAGVGMYASFAFLPQFLQTPPSAGYGFGSTVSESGLVMLIQTGSSFVTGLVAGRLAHRISPRSLLLVGVLTGAAGYAVMSLAHEHFWQACLAVVLIGIGFGGTFAAMANLVVAAVPPEQTGVASGMNANIRTVGGAIGSALMSTVVTASNGPTGLPAEGGYTTGFGLLALATLAAAAAALLVPRARREPVVPRRPEVPTHPQAALVPGGTLAGSGEE